MTLFYITLGLIVAAAAVYFYAIKTGKIEDADGDLVADEIEDAIEDVKEVAKEVKRRAKNVKAELGDVKKAAKELLDQAEEVVEAASGKTRKGRKPAAKKAPAK
jgi:gas vesicle protein